MNHAPIIIFDGPDNVGKGTQIKLLRKKLVDTPFNITNLDKPVGETLLAKQEYGLENINNQLQTMVAGSALGIPQLADRGHYSEYAYSILRITHSMKVIQMIEEQYLSSKDNILGIIFIDTVKNISDRDDGESNYDKDDLETIETIIQRFKETKEHSHFPTYIIDIQGKDKDLVHKEVMQHILNHFPQIS